jgi:hypothetical protein
MKQDQELLETNIHIRISRRLAQQIQETAKKKHIKTGTLARCILENHLYEYEPRNYPFR